MLLKHLSSLLNLRYLRILVDHRSKENFEYKLRIFAIINGLAGTFVIGLALVALNKNWNLTDKYYFISVGPVAIMFGFIVVYWVGLKDAKKIQTYKYLLPGFLIYVLIVNILRIALINYSVVLLSVPGLLILVAVFYEIFESAKIYYNSTTSE